MLLRCYPGVPRKEIATHLPIMPVCSDADRGWLACLSHACRSMHSADDVGFIGKTYVLTAAVGSSFRLLVIFVVVGSVIELYYYLRIISATCTHDPKATPGSDATFAISASVAESVALPALTLLLIWLGVYHAFLIHVIETTVIYLAWPPAFPPFVASL